MSDIVHVIAIITAKPGQRTTVLEQFLANVPAVHAEDGCIEYQAVTDLPDAGGFQADLGPDSFLVVEKWESLDALKAHAAAPHMQTYGAAVADMLADRKIHVLSNA